MYKIKYIGYNNKILGQEPYKNIINYLIIVVDFHYRYFKKLGLYKSF